METIVWLQNNGNGFFDALAEILHLLGGSWGYLITLPLLYWSVNHRLGRQMLFVLVFGIVGFVALKEATMIPRPFVQYPDVITPLVEETGYSFPSGHVTLSLVVWGYLAYIARRWWTWAALAVYMALMAWSRVYAGVHFPVDVLAGLVWGAVLLGAAILLVKPIERWWTSSPTAIRIGVITILGVIIAVLLRGDEQGLSAAGILMGGGLGLIIDERGLHFSSDGTAIRRVLLGVGGLILTVLAYVILSELFESLTPAELWRVLRYALLALVIFALWPWVAMRLGVSQPKAALAG